MKNEESELVPALDETFGDVSVPLYAVTKCLKECFDPGLCILVASLFLIDSIKVHRPSVTAVVSSD